MEAKVSGAESNDGESGVKRVTELMGVSCV